MKKAIGTVVILTAFFAAGIHPAAAQEEVSDMQEAPQQGDVRGTDGAGQEDAFSAWGRYFGRELPDPLDAEDMQEYQENKEDYDRRGQAAAEFTDAASSLVQALPTGTAAANAGGMVVSESAQAVVDAESSDEPGVLGTIWNGIVSFVSWINPFD